MFYGNILDEDPARSEYYSRARQSWQEPYAALG
jgi:hypothetical protein